MGRRLANIRDVPLKLDLSCFNPASRCSDATVAVRNYRLHEFNIKAEIATREEVAQFAVSPLSRFDPRRLRGLWWRFARCYTPSLCSGMRVYENAPDFDPRMLKLPGDVYLEGWWQSENYFLDYATPLRDELTLQDTAFTQRIIAEISSRRNGHRPLVAVQVRRGDVARAHEIFKDLTHMPYELVSKDYLHAAMSIFGDDATFLVFSETAEDFAWCRANLHASDIHFLENGSDLHDFVAMSNCDHNIISNSSFGWWAAWLNLNPAKVVVAPRRWFRTAYAPQFNSDSLIPATWILI